ncbi:MAG: hypothetical protein GY906_10965 [bacterium]|nr:hypothetical protein [bacterium]
MKIMKITAANQRILPSHMSLALVMAFFLVALGAGFPALAQEESSEGSSAQKQEKANQAAAAPSSQQKLGIKKNKSGKATTLSDLAAQIKLQKPEQDPNDPVVISNQDVARSSKSGTITFGSTLSGGSVPAPLSEGTQNKADPQRQAAIDEQQKRIQEIQEEVGRVDKMLELEGNPYTNSGAHFRPGGIKSGFQVERDRLAKELESEQAKLQKMERQAARRQR